MEKRYYTLFKRFVLGTNWLKTIRLNFHYFSLKQAIRFPILVAHRTVFKKLGGGISIEGPLTTGMFLFGYQGVGSIDAFYERTLWDVAGIVTIKGKRIDIGRGSKFCVYGNCFLGDRFSISGRSTIICNKDITFGDNVLLSWDVLIMDTDLHKIHNSDGSIINKDKSIIIGDNVWIGCRTVVLKGSIITSNTVIAANSLISGKLEKERCIYSSNQKIIKENVSWSR